MQGPSRRWRVAVTVLAAGALILMEAATALAAPPTLVEDINATPGEGSNPYDFTRIGGVIYFAASSSGDDANFREIYRTDGTPSGTRRVKHTGFTSADGLTKVGNALFFSGFEGGVGFELWKSDGSKAGTHVIKDINPGMASSTPEWITPVGSTAYFSAVGPGGRELWKSDGTAAGTKRVKDIDPAGDSSPQDFQAMDGTLYFTASVNGDSELWKSDGTAAGTKRVKDINPLGSSGIRDPAVLDHKLYFAADDGTHGAELWRSDGTKAGTKLIKDLNTTSPGAAGNPVDLHRMGDSIFFSADDGVNGRELWRTDGTGPVTFRISDINAAGGSNPIWQTPLDGDLYFFAEDGGPGLQLYTTNGTLVGTHLVADTGSDGSQLTAIGGVLYFRADGGTGDGSQLWVSDGTGPGTHQLKVINPTGDTEIENPVGLGNVVFFKANDGTHGAELWKRVP